MTLEPMNGYAWETTNILLPNELLTKPSTEGDEGDGFLDVFGLL